MVVRGPSRTLAPPVPLCLSAPVTQLPLECPLGRGTQRTEGSHVHALVIPSLCRVEAAAGGQPVTAMGGEAVLPGLGGFARLRGLGTRPAALPRQGDCTPVTGTHVTRWKSSIGHLTEHTGVPKRSSSEPRPVTHVTRENRSSLRRTPSPCRRRKHKRRPAEPPVSDVTLGSPSNPTTCWRLRFWSGDSPISGAG